MRPLFFKSTICSVFFTLFDKLKYHIELLILYSFYRLLKFVRGQNLGKFKESSTKMNHFCLILLRMFTKIREATYRYLSIVFEDYVK